MNKWADIDFDRCDPRRCNGGDGVCLAARACTHKILEQEAPFDPPMLLSLKLCVGCGNCVTECPFGAIQIRSG
ncbi:MAG: 4Fe-4S binding protein [Spirochaetales bacterium]|nr:4Fe-4S binding protein [Spirochaetales bacterium]